MPTVIVSKPDPASMLIGKYLTEHYFEPTDKSFGEYRVHTYKNADLIIINTLHVHAQWLEEMYPSDLYIVASKHSAESGIPCLTVHTTGNWGDAMLGGFPRTLSYAPAQYMLAALQALKKEKEKRGLEKYSVSYEATHHGPTLNTPIMFVEIGSTEEEWMDQEAAAAVGEAIIHALEPVDVPTAIGIGGGHYAPRFTDIALRKGIAFGHIAPRYALEQLDEYMFRQAVEKTVPTPAYISFHGVPEHLLDLFLEWASSFKLKPVK